MQVIHPQFLVELRAKERSVVELWEFYSQDETDFSDPSKAVARFSNVGTENSYNWVSEFAWPRPVGVPANGGGYTWQGHAYERRVVSRGDIRRFLGKQANTVSLTLTNADFALSRLVTDYRMEGMWVQVRQPSLTAPNESLILFAGRCSKPDECYPSLTVTISQDTGADVDFPARKLNVICPLAKDFKGVACRGGKPLSEHTAAYQAAVECNGSRKQCSEYGNLENNQAYSFVPVTGTFSYQTVETQRFLLFFQRKKKRIASAPYSSVSDAQQDLVIPECGGLVQVEGVPLMHVDKGAKVAFLHALCEGEIDGAFNVAIRDKQYLPAPDTGTQQVATGKYGSQGQPESVQFPGAGTFSGTAYLEGVAVGSDPADANDSSPTVTAVLRARKFETPDNAGNFAEDQLEWTDCGPYMVRHYLVTLGRMLRSQIDNESVIAAAKKTFEPVVDDTGFEQVVLPSNLTGGVDFRAYASAGGFGAATIDKILLLMSQGKQITGGYGQLVEAYYRYRDQNTLPTYVAPNRKIRRRYTTNFVIKEQDKLSNAIFDIILQSFNGQLIYSANGQVQIRVDGPAPHTYLADLAAPTATTIAVEDVRPWLNALNTLVIVSPHTEAAELTKVVGYAYDQVTDDPIDVIPSASGTLTCAASSATLIGGDDNTPASSTITVGGSVSAGASVSLTIDGITVDYTCQADDDRDAVAGYLAATINGEPTLRRYLRADWSGESTFKLELKTGYLTLADALTKDHALADEVLRVEAAYGGNTQYDLRYREDSFKWPLGGRASSYNRFAGEIRSITHDWANVPIERNVITHQRQVRKTNTLEMNLSAVDNAHQAARLLKITAGKHRTCDWYCSFAAPGDALLHDVGDVIAVSHYSSDKLNFVPVVIEDIVVDRNQEARLVCRLYHSKIYDDRIASIDSPLLFPLQSGTKLSATADSTTDKLTLTSHSLVVGNVVYVTTGAGGVLPSPLVEGTPYYVQNVSGNDIKLSLTNGGSAIDLTTNGTAPFYVLTGLSANTDTPPVNVPSTGTPGSGLGGINDGDYTRDGYGTGGGVSF